MRQESIEHKQVLIYEKNGDDLTYLKHQCQEFGIDVLTIEHPGQVEEILSQNKIDTAIVNIELPKIVFALDLPVIAVGSENYSAAINLVRYNPVAFVPKPLKSSMVKLGLAKALKVPMMLDSYPARLIEIHSLLKEVEYHLNHLDQHDMSNATFDESVYFFCTSACHIAKTSEDVEGKSEGYEVIEILNQRGTIMCNQIDQCKLRQFAKYMNVKVTEKLSRRPDDHLGLISEGDNEQSFLNIVQKLAKLYDREIYQLYQQKKKFCCEICNETKEDLAYQQGDNLHSTREEMLRGRVSYCQRPTCVLENFFNIQGRKIL